MGPMPPCSRLKQQRARLEMMAELYRNVIRSLAAANGHATACLNDGDFRLPNGKTFV
jgi:hypothetical protein